MILLVLAALQSATVPSKPVDPEIIVLGRKLQRIDVDMKLQKRAGKMVLRSCRITRPSVEIELDAIPCGAAQQCVIEGVASRSQLVECVEHKSNQQIDAIIAKRRKASDGS